MKTARCSAPGDHGADEATHLQAHRIHDRRVLQAMKAISPEAFPSEASPPTSDSEASDTSAARLPDPILTATMLQALALRGNERVLEIGTGTGYRAALLGMLASEVYSLEIVPERAQAARRSVEKLGLGNVTILDRNGIEGLEAARPYQAILVSAAMMHVPQPLLDQLDDGGRLVIPLGSADAQLVELVIRRGVSVESRTLTWCRVPPLRGEEGREICLPWVAAGSS